MSSLLKHPVTVVILTLLAVFYYLSLDKSARKAAVSSQTVAQLHGEMDQVQSEVAQLHSQLESANHPITQEKAIRNELLLQKPGEYILQVPDLEVLEAVQRHSEELTPWEEWKKLLF